MKISDFTKGIKFLYESCGRTKEPSDFTIGMWYEDCKDIEITDYLGGLKLMLSQECINFSQFPVQSQIIYYSKKYKNDLWIQKEKEKTEQERAKQLPTMCAEDMEKNDLEEIRKIRENFKKKMRFSDPITLKEVVKINERKRGRLRVREYSNRIY
jgi:hypothetical protein